MTATEPVYKVLPFDQLDLSKRSRKDLGTPEQQEELLASIKKLGLLHVPIVNERNEVCDGGRRIITLKKLGIKEHSCRVVEGMDPLEVELDANDTALHNSISERAINAERRRKATKGRQGKAGAEPLRDEVAKEYGFSSASMLDRATLAAKKGAAEVVKAMDRGEISVARAAKLATLDKESQAKELAAMRQGKGEGVKPIRGRKRYGLGARATTDNLGQEIPDRLLDVFRDPSLGRVREVLRKALEEFHWEKPFQELQGKIAWYPYLHGDENAKRLDKARAIMTEVAQALANAVPFAVCPKCGGSGDKCKACLHGSGYLTSWRLFDLRKQGILPVDSSESAS